MKCIFLLLFSISFGFISGQQITGKWVGVFHSSGEGTPTSFLMHMDLRQSNLKITGNSVIEIQKGTTRAYEISGINDKSGMYNFSFAGYTNTASVNIPPSNNYIEVIAALSKNDTSEILFGTWISANMEGKFWASKVDTIYEQRNDDFISFNLFKKKKPKVFARIPESKITREKVEPAKKENIKTEPLKNDGLKKETVKKDAVPQKKEAVIIKKEPVIPFEKRKNKLTGTIVVPSPEVVLELYDNGEIDGDSITVYINNRVQVQKKLLSTEAIKIPLTLEKNTSYTVTLFAENLGRVAPNTAVMLVKAKNYNNSLFLSASLEQNVSVVIKLK